MLEALIGFFVAIAIFIVISALIIFLISLLFSPSTHRFLRVVFLFIVVLIIYYFLGKFLIAYVTTFLNFTKSKAGMESFDNIWYIIFIIFILLITATIIKSVRETHLRWNLLMASIGTLLALLLYTVVMYIYMYRDDVLGAMGTLTIIMVFVTLIIIFLRNFNNILVSIIYLLYAFLSFIYVLCLMVCLIKLFVYIYDYVFI